MRNTGDTSKIITAKGELTMENGNYVTISLERYEQLIRAEHDANQLKAMIDAESSIDYNGIGLLKSIYIGNKEETK